MSTNQLSSKNMESLELEKDNGNVDKIPNETFGNKGEKTKNWKNEHEFENEIIKPSKVVRNAKKDPEQKKENDTISLCYEYGPPIPPLNRPVSEAQSLDSKVNVIISKVNSLDSNSFQTTNAVNKRLETRMDRLETRMDRLETQMHNLENNINSFMNKIYQMFEKTLLQKETIRADTQAIRNSFELIIQTDATLIRNISDRRDSMILQVSRMSKTE
jgi:exonuclease VII small subunit